MLAWSRGLPPEAIHDSLLDATPDEKLLARHIAQEMAKGLREAGALPPQRTADDLTMHQLEALSAVWGVVSGWDVSLKADRTLGACKKVLLPEVVARIDEILAWGAAVHEEDGDASGS
jgi:hypothetical protein